MHANYVLIHLITARQQLHMCIQLW